MGRRCPIVDLDRIPLSLASKRRFIGSETPFRETRDAKGIFQDDGPSKDLCTVAVDEALSAAMKAELRRIKVSGDKLVKTSDVLNSIWNAALDHLVDVRGLDRKQSWSAVTARLTKKRRYSSASG